MKIDNILKCIFNCIMEINTDNYGALYEHLCSAQYIADELKDSHAESIMKIRQEIGDILLKLHSNTTIKDITPSQSDK